VQEARARVNPREERIEQQEISNRRSNQNRLAANAVRECPAQRNHQRHANEPNDLRNEGFVQWHIQLFIGKCRHVHENHVVRNRATNCEPKGYKYAAQMLVEQYAHRLRLSFSARLNKRLGLFKMTADI
jgi:hypothetical protein